MPIITTLEMTRSPEDLIPQSPEYRRHPRRGECPGAARRPIQTLAQRMLSKPQLSG